jgi:hypothetical protein
LAVEPVSTGMTIGLIVAFHWVIATLIAPRRSNPGRSNLQQNLLVGNTLLQIHWLAEHQARRPPHG